MEAPRDGDIITWESLEEWLSSGEHSSIQPAAKIRHVKMGSVGIVFRLCEVLSEKYRSGDLIVFWSDGDYGVCNPGDEVEVVEADAWGERRQS